MKRPEQALHIGVVHFLRLAMPPEIVWLHIPNGGYRTAREAALFKALGQLAGAPDLMFVLPGGKVSFIELKAPKMTLSDAQKAFRDRVLDLGCGYVLARSLDDVCEALEGWGVVLKAKLARAA